MGGAGPTPGDDCGDVGWCSTVSMCTDALTGDTTKRCEELADVYSAGDGSSCATAKCALGLTCNTSTQTCTQPANLGAACTSVACAPTLGCDEGVCVSRPAIGEACSSGDTCADDGVFCFDDVCRPLGRVGDACDSFRDCSTLNCGDAGTCESYEECVLAPI